MRTWRIILGAALWACLTSLCLAETTVESFSPEGTVKGVRQVRARFTGQIVPFGDLRLSDPFTTDCPEAGTGRRVDGRNWSYDFARDLPAGIACTFVLKSELQDLAGTQVGGKRQFGFSTGGPAVIESLPSDGTSELDENQVFILGLDAVARPESIEKNVYCRVNGVNEKIGVRLVGGKQRDDILALRKNFLNRYLDVYFKARGVVWKTTLAFNSDRLAKLPLTVLQCKRTLPANTLS